MLNLSLEARDQKLAAPLDLLDCAGLCNPVKLKLIAVSVLITDKLPGAIAEAEKRC